LQRLIPSPGRVLRLSTMVFLPIALAFRCGTSTAPGSPAFRHRPPPSNTPNWSRPSPVRLNCSEATAARQVQTSTGTSSLGSVPMHHCRSLTVLWCPQAGFHPPTVCARWVSNTFPAAGFSSTFATKPASSSSLPFPSPPTRGDSRCDVTVARWGPVPIPFPSEATALMDRRFRFHERRSSALRSPPSSIVQSSELHQTFVGPLIKTPTRPSTGRSRFPRPPNKLLKQTAAPRRVLHCPPSRPWRCTTGSLVASGQRGPFWMRPQLNSGTLGGRL
jgi:hypothetical protein